MAEQMELPAVREQGQAPATLNNSPAELMRIAIETGADPAYLEKLMDLQDRHNKGIAEKAYFVAMNAVQSDMKPVVARHRNSETRSTFAKLKDVAQEITPIYLKHGFSITFSEGEALHEAEFRTIATVMHVAGHKVEHHIDLEIDDKGPKGGAVKTKVQGKGSSITYARRYLLCSIFNLQIVDDDNDGNPPNNRKFASLALEEINHLKGLVKEADVNVQTFFKAHKATKYEDFPKDQYQKAVKALNQRIDQKNAA